MSYTGGDRRYDVTHENIEVRNETEADHNVVVCQSKHTGALYVHLLGDREAIHGDDATTVPAEGYDKVPINEDKR